MFVRSVSARSPFVQLRVHVVALKEPDQVVYHCYLFRASDESAFASDRNGPAGSISAFVGFLY